MSLNNQPTFRFLILALFFLAGLETISSAQSLKYSTSLFQNKDWSFVENKGQVSSKDIKYYGHQGGVYLYCKSGMIEFLFTKIEKEGNEKISEATGGDVSDVGVQNLASPLAEPQHRKLPEMPSKITTSRADLVLINSNPNAQIHASDQQEYYESYYTTGNADSGITNVHTFKTITYKSIYPYIDMVLSCREKGLEYSFVVYPGGKVSDIQMQWNGIEKIQKLKDSKIEYSCALGKVDEGKPVSFQGGNRVESDFLRHGNWVGFQVNGYDKQKVLVIDPALDWATYFGGIGFDAGSSIVNDASGNSYLAGYSYNPNGSSGTNFIIKFNGNGAKLWSSYYGSVVGFSSGIALDGSGNVYLSGGTQSTSGIATSGAYQTSFGGGSSYGGDAFVAKFSAAGTLIWGTYFGGSGDDRATGITIDKGGNAYITGITNSTSQIATNGAY